MAASEPSEAVSHPSAPTPTPWELPPVDADVEGFKNSMEKVLHAFKCSVIETWGGPSQYLQAKLPNATAKQDFVDWLWAAFPLSETCVYSLEDPLHAVSPNNLGEMAPLRVHVASLGFGSRCSFKPDPSGHASLLLLEHILQDGFLTGGQPLLVRHIADKEPLFAPWAKLSSGMPLTPFSLGYVKGALRATTLLAFLHLVWEDESLLGLFPQIRSTVTAIFCHHVVHASVQDEVFQNFKLSLMGSIRKPPNLLTWILTLASLKQHGYEDSAAVIQRFNSTVGKSSQLLAAKATAVGNLMTHFPESLLCLMQAHVSKYGWEGCALSDDGLSTKKILPIHVHKAPTKGWKKYASMSVQATELVFRKLFHDFDSNPQGRRKADRASPEQSAESAALLVNLAKALQDQFPVKTEDIEKQIFDKWVEGHMGLELELHELASEKKETLACTDVKFFRGVVDTVRAKMPLSDGHGETVQLTALEKDKYDLTVKQINFDRQAFRIYKAKLENFETHIHLAKVDWKNNRREETTAHVRSWLSNKSCIFQYNASDSGALMTVLNWSAPSTQTDAAQEAQAISFCQLVSGSASNLGLLLCPVFHYKKNQMHVLEHTLVKCLASKGVDVDHQASLLFKERKDSRDTRPLQYPLRVVRPLAATAVDDEGEKVSKKNLPGSHWLAAPLLSKGRTEEADQVAATKLKQVEDLNETAVPATTDISGSIQGGRRFEQIGASAAQKLLESVLHVDMPAKVTGVCIVDLTVGVGDTFWAWLERQGGIRKEASVFFFFRWG
ncbi:Uncharacterized protein SCF082_LOCUS15069 [Durusdinium trenchii]|uniref:Uncharacterized protein n=1 Tax=Durusdinium trenchii TaxID=1381693 RepID=A0ABP0K2E8_9DINO